MKIRTLVKHLLFKISRQFFRIRRFLAVFGLVLALLLSSFVVYAEGNGYSPIFYSDVANYFTVIRGTTVVGDTFSYSVSKPWNTKLYIRDYVTGPFNDLLVNVALKEDVTGEDIDSPFGLPLAPGQTILVNVTYDFASVPGVNTGNIKFGLGLSFIQDTDTQPYYSEYAVTRSASGNYAVGVQAYYTNNTTSTLYLNVLSFIYNHSLTGGSNPENFSFLLREATYRYLSETEVVGQNIVSAIDKQTGEILNFEVEPTTPEGADTVGDVGSAEDELINQNEEGFNQFGNIMDGLSGNLETYASAFAAVGNLIMSFVYLPFFTAIFYISLAFGLFGLLVNLGSLLNANHRMKTREAQAEKRRAEAQVRREKYYASRKKKGGG